MKRFTSILAVIMTLGMATSIQAAPITPQMTSFGTLAGATFGGSGIPNTDVAITTTNDAVLGLTDTARFDNTAPTNDGAGNFFAEVGNDAAHGQLGYTTDNFDWYAQLFAVGTLTMEYDSDPAQTDDANWQPVFSMLLGPGMYQNSWNPGMAFLPEGTDPNNPNMTSVRLRFAALNSPLQIAGLGGVTINTYRGVDPPVPEPVELSLLGIGLVGLVAWRNRQKRQAVVA